MDTRVKPAYDIARKHPGASRLFFVLSKTIGIMLLPTNFLIGIGVLGALLLATRIAPAGRKLLIASVMLLAICGFSPLGYLLLYPTRRVTVILFRFLTDVPAYVAIGIWFAFQLISGLGILGGGSQQGGVAYAAHVGGFVAGLVLVKVFALGRDSYV